METRCAWCTTDPLYVTYHDTEWGVPELDAQALFEKLILEGFQAGLSWLTILRKRENFREAFDGFNPIQIAQYSETKIENLMQNTGIIRNRKKIESTIHNAKAWITLSETDAFNAFLWQFVDFKPQQNTFTEAIQIPAKTPQSEAMSKALKKAGFKFCGPTICYSLMQACGMVNDHLITCPRYRFISEYNFPESFPCLIDHSTTTQQVLLH